ncbi:VOC family protein [Actinophytocola sp.]|uniref:VOC family protein n=1 Tax=Actinophytocola sp. TaxID=1872138 RepID=UPI003D6C4CF9
MLNRLFHIAINSTDLDRSVAFYQRLGFTALQDRTVRNDVVKQAFAVPTGDLRFVHLRLGEDEQATVLDIVQWFGPGTADTGNGPVEQHRRGLTRFSVLTDDTQRVYDELSAEGVEFITEPTSVLTPAGGWKVCLLRDPDDVVVQITELLPAPGTS